MNIRGSSRLFFVIADPVVQVKAPLALNHVFHHERLDAIAVPAQVSPSHLEGFVSEACALGNAGGLLVSIPHKTALLGILDRFDPAARAAGAVNAVRRAPDGALEGALFDGIGFINALREQAVAVSGRRVLLLGAGGAGLAIASALAALPLAQLEVVDVAPERAASLARRIADVAGFAVTAAGDPAHDRFDILINATPLGLREEDPLPFEPARVRAEAIVVDILMTAAPSRLVRACSARGIVAHSGHEMLLQQLPPYLEFFGYAAAARRLSEPGGHMLQNLRSILSGASGA